MTGRPSAESIYESDRQSANKSGITQSTVYILCVQLVAIHNNNQLPIQHEYVWMDVWECVTDWFRSTVVSPHDRSLPVMLKNGCAIVLHSTSSVWIHGDSAYTFSPYLRYNKKQNYLSRRTCDQAGELWRIAGNQWGEIPGNCMGKRIKEKLVLVSPLNCQMQHTHTGPTEHQQKMRIMVFWTGLHKLRWWGTYIRKLVYDDWLVTNYIDVKTTVQIRRIIPLIT